MARAPVVTTGVHFGGYMLEVFAYHLSQASSHAVYKDGHSEEVQLFVILDTEI